jgi:hypothetical protein
VPTTLVPECHAKGDSDGMCMRWQAMILIGQSPSPHPNWNGIRTTLVVNSVDIPTKIGFWFCHGCRAWPCNLKKIIICNMIVARATFYIPNIQ